MPNETKPLFRPGHDVTVLTTAAVTGKTFVAVSADRTTTGHIRVATAGSGVKAFGVASRDIASGDYGAIIREAATFVTAGGSIAAGAQVEVGSGGKAVTLSTGVAVGQALETGTNNNDVLIALDL
jgi:hypothetical protein